MIVPKGSNREAPDLADNAQGMDALRQQADSLKGDSGALLELIRAAQGKETVFAETFRHAMYVATQCLRVLCGMRQLRSDIIASPDVQGATAALADCARMTEEFRAGLEALGLTDLLEAAQMRPTPKDGANQSSAEQPVNLP